jgi:hypothetical protein
MEQVQQTSRFAKSFRNLFRLFATIPAFLLFRGYPYLCLTLALFGGDLCRPRKRGSAPRFRPPPTLILTFQRGETHGAGYCQEADFIHSERPRRLIQDPIRKLAPG